MITCRTCKETKEETEFYKVGGCKSRPNRKGISKECKVCSRVRTKRNSTPKSRRYNMVKFKFGIAKEEYDQLLEEFPVCANPNCRKEFGLNEPHVDHCHTTGKIRGLLCSGCNIGLGHCREDANILRGLASYIENFKGLAADCPIEIGDSSN